MIVYYLFIPLKGNDILRIGYAVGLFPMHIPGAPFTNTD